MIEKLIGDTIAIIALMKISIKRCLNAGLSKVLIILFGLYIMNLGNILATENQQAIINDVIEVKKGVDMRKN